MFEDKPDSFAALFARVRALTLEDVGMRENEALVHFLIRCFQSVVRCGAAGRNRRCLLHTHGVGPPAPPLRPALAFFFSH